MGCLRVSSARLVLSLVVVASVALAACGSTTTTSGSKTLKVAVVLPGPANDKGYNQQAYSALQQVKDKFGAQVAFSEDVPQPQFEQTFRTYAQQGFDVVIGQGNQFGDTAKKVGPDFPKTKFLVVGSNDLAGPNLQGLNPLLFHGAYLAGIVAGMTTKSGKIAGVAGDAFPAVVDQMEAYKLGAKSVRPDVKATVTYLGTFDDVQKAKEATKAAISGGADVIFHVADAAGLGVIEAAQEAKVWAIGFASDQNSLAPNTVITSVVINFSIPIVNAVQAIVDNKFSGQVMTLDLGPAITLAPIRNLDPGLTSQINTKVTAATQAVVSGSLQVPDITKPTQG